MVVVCCAASRAPTVSRGAEARAPARALGGAAVRRSYLQLLVLRNHGAVHLRVAMPDADGHDAREAVEVAAAGVVVQVLHAALGDHHGLLEVVEQAGRQELLPRRQRLRGRRAGVRRRHVVERRERPREGPGRRRRRRRGRAGRAARERAREQRGGQRLHVRRRLHHHLPPHAASERASARARERASRSAARRPRRDGKASTRTRRRARDGWHAEQRRVRTRG